MLWAKLRFAIRTQWTTVLLIVVLAIFGFIILVLPTPGTSVWNAIQTVSGFVAFCLPIIYFLLTDRWEEELPKRLDVEYRYKGSTAMLCENATLVAEGDIRAMAQQIGAQLIGERFLQMSQIVDLSGPNTEPEREAGNTFIRRYGITIYLTALPKHLSEIQDN